MVSYQSWLKIHTERLPQGLWKKAHGLGEYIYKLNEYVEDWKPSEYTI